MFSRYIIKFLIGNNVSKDFTKLRNISSKFDFISISEEVRYAMERKEPIVALESTIITHGMSYPDNLKCALEVEDIVRKQGAIPATIGIVNGQINVGLSKDLIKRLAESHDVLKVSARDIPYAISNKKDGGTTVSATIKIMKKVNLQIFATGGIGGVHRGVETSYDISADLIELGKTSVTVICSGVKSILDIPKTLEYLETQSVSVVSFGNSKEFPAFYTRCSGFFSPHNVENSTEAARLIKAHLHLDFGSALLIAVPIPEEYAISAKKIEAAIKLALDEVQRKEIKGKDVTPFLLKNITAITKGKSLIANIALIKNNAKIAAEIAIEFNKRNETVSNRSHACKNKSEEKVGPVIVGGSLVDYCATLKESEKIVS